MAPQKQIHINFFDMANVGNHTAFGMWQDPNDNTRSKDSLEYYIWLARLAEKGKVSCVFFADGYGTQETYQGRADAALRSGNAPPTDPVVWISAMASAAKNVSFAVTGSTSYINPFLLARTWSTLDHATKGRFAWNIVTSYSNTSATAMGRDAITPKALRYEEAHEYMDLVYSLWEGSWEDGCQPWKMPIGAYDPSKIHKIYFTGKYHKTAAYNATCPSPQRTPVLFQAGGSPEGKRFAAKHAECVFLNAASPELLSKSINEIRDLSTAVGRDKLEIKFFVPMSFCLGRTLEEALEKYKKYERLADWEGGLAKISGFLNIDFSQYPLDEPFDYNKIGLSSAAIQGYAATIKSDTVALTPRELGRRAALGGVSIVVGTPETAADTIEEWINVGGIDGLNVSNISNPQTFEDFVDLLVPVLIERGIMWKDYAVPGGTLRENLWHESGRKHASPTHPSSNFRYERMKAEYGDEYGDIHINRIEGSPQVEEQPPTSKSDT